MDASAQVDPLSYAQTAGACVLKVDQPELPDQGDADQVAGQQQRPLLRGAEVIVAEAHSDATFR